MSQLHYSWPRFVVLIIIFLFLPSLALTGHSVDEDPRETPLDPGDMFQPGGVTEVDDGDGGFPPGFPNLNVPNPQLFDLDAFSVEAPLEVCPDPAPPYIPGILFSIDDGDPGPGSSLPDNFTEIFFYDHCLVIDPTMRRSYYTSITEHFLGLGSDPPPTSADDDVDAYETRNVDQDPWYLLFSPDTPSNGGFGAGSEGNIYYIDSTMMIPPTVWATPATLGLPDVEHCDIDGIATIFEEEKPYVILFTTDANASCGVDPGDIFVSNNSGSYWLYADDVTDMKIAYDEEDEVDIDALAINYFGDFEIDGTYEYDDPNFYKADWPNYAPNGMPDFSQDHTGWQPTWCGPTAVADSFWWFDSEMECDLDLTSGDSSETEPNDTSANADRLGEVPSIPGNLATNTDIDWYQFDIPYKQYRICRVTVSTCALRQAGDADTMISLYDGSSGSPGTLIAQNDDGCPPNTQSEIIAKVSGGTRYFVKVEPGAAGGPIGNYTLSLGIDCYRLVEKYQDKPDDHSDHNVRPLIEDLSVCMDTDNVSGPGSWKGTRIADMQTCIDNWLINKGLDDEFTEVTRSAPHFDDVEEEIERSEDVILLLGFYWWDGGSWIRCGGHFVTSAGVDSPGQTITFSDPGLNNAEPPNSAPGRVLGPNHINHAPSLNPPPSHDDAQNLSHDRYGIGPSMVPAVAKWAIPNYATSGAPTTCADVARWCMLGYDWGQNPPPPDPPQPQIACTDPTAPVSTEVEAMVDVSPVQTPICIYFDSAIPWPDNLMIDKNPCGVSSPTAVSYDWIRGKLCNLRFSMLSPQVDLGYVQCLVDDGLVDRYDELSPDDTQCMGGWFYLIRQSTDPDYGNASNGDPRIPNSGGCP